MPVPVIWVLTLISFCRSGGFAGSLGPDCLRWKLVRQARLAARLDQAGGAGRRPTI
jgi:hypothetical protein